MRRGAGQTARGRRALVIRMGALGDLALCEPVVRRLRGAATKVDMLTDERYVSWADAAMGADRVFGCTRGLRGVFAAAQCIRRGGYDLVVDLQGKLRTRLMVALAWPPIALTWRRRRGLRLFWALVGQDRPDHSIYQSDSLLRALTPLRLSGLPDGSWPVLRNGEPSDGEQRRAKVRRVGICVGGSKVSKRWPVPRFAAVVRRLADDDIEFVAIGGADDRQRLLALYEEAPEVRWAASTVDLDVLGLARAVARLDLLISNDTGPAHLAAGYGVPLVAIFGPTSWVRWAPPSSRRSVTVVRHAVECAPCSNFGGDRCPRADSAWTCMLGLEPQRVVHAAQTLLRGRQAL